MLRISCQSHIASKVRQHTCPTLVNTAAVAHDLRRHHVSIQYTNLCASMASFKSLESSHAQQKIRALVETSKDVCRQLNEQVTCMVPCDTHEEPMLLFYRPTTVEAEKKQWIDILDRTCSKFIMITVTPKV